MSTPFLVLPLCSNSIQHPIVGKDLYNKLFTPNLHKLQSRIITFNNITIKVSNDYVCDNDFIAPKEFINKHNLNNTIEITTEDNNDNIIYLPLIYVANPDNVSLKNLARQITRLQIINDKIFATNNYDPNFKLEVTSTSNYFNNKYINNDDILNCIKENKSKYFIIDTCKNSTDHDEDKQKVTNFRTSQSQNPTPQHITIEHYTKGAYSSISSTTYNTIIAAFPNIIKNDEETISANIVKTNYHILHLLTNDERQPYLLHNPETKLTTFIINNDQQSNTTSTIIPK